MISPCYIKVLENHLLLFMKIRCRWLIQDRAPRTQRNHGDYQAERDGGRGPCGGLARKFVRSIPMKLQGLHEGQPEDRP
jgi:hypothetical protein